MAENEPRPPVRARRWSPSGPSPRKAKRPYRLALRLIGIPAVAVAGVLIYQGLRDRLVLPECDSTRAKHTLADVLKSLKLEPSRYESLKTVSSNHDQVVCSAMLPLSDGGSIAIDYTFYWDGDTANMKYSIARKPPTTG